MLEGKGTEIDLEDLGRRLENSEDLGPEEKVAAVMLEEHGREVDVAYREEDTARKKVERASFSAGMGALAYLGYDIEAEPTVNKVFADTVGQMPEIIGSVPDSVSLGGIALGTGFAIFSNRYVKSSEAEELDTEEVREQGLGLREYEALDPEYVELVSDLDRDYGVDLHPKS